MVRLNEFARDVTSQNGEDGMIVELVRELGLGPGQCVEFGAWDGKYLSNTWELRVNHGWSAFLIEALPSRFSLLERETEEKQKNGLVVTMCARVSWEGDSRLDLLLKAAGVSPDFDLLSIDIDGDDYWVWEATASRPKIVVVEYNASFAPEVEFIQEKGAFTGSSAASFIRLAEKKGYTLIDLTMTNLILVRADLAITLAVDVLPLEELFHRSWLPIIYSDFAGVHHLIRSGQWQYGGFRADLGRERIVGPLRRTFGERPARWMIGQDWPVAREMLEKIKKWAYR